MQIKDMPEQKTAAVRLTVSIDELPASVGAAYGKIMAHLANTDARIVGPPFVLYHNADMHALDVEIGFPVDRNVPGEGRVESSLLPGGRVLSAIHVGPYAKLEQTYAPLMKHIEDEGLQVTEWMYELYLNSPETTPQEQLQTEICFPLAE